MKKRILFQITLLPILVFTLQSCFVSKQYKRPEVIDAAKYRTDKLPEDSLTMAEVSWRDMFTDSLLIGYIEEGLKNNIDIRIAIEQIKAAEAFFKQGKAGYLPIIGAGGEVAYQKLSENSQFGALTDGALTQYGLSATLSWEADIWGKIRSTRRAFEASYLQSVAAHQAVKTVLIANIASIYYQLLAFDEQLRIIEETIRNRESSLETTKALKRSGYVTEAGVKQTEAQIYTARSILIDTKLNIKLLENTMSILLGKAPESTIKRSSLEKQEINQELNVGFPVQLLRNRPDVIAAEYGLINAFELTNVAKANFYPSLNITAAGGLQSLELDKLFSVNSLFASVIGGLTQPLLQGRRIRTQYEVALAQQEIAYLDFRQALLNASREVSDALFSYEAAEDRIAAKTSEFEAYNTAASYSMELLNNGLANYLEVLTAQASALNSQLDLINARFTRLNSVVEVYKALGGGWR